MFYILIFCIILAYLFLIKLYNYWQQKCVKQTNPLLFFGDNLSNIIGPRKFAEFILKAYNSHPNTRYIGIYQFLRPILIIRDPELIQQITVKKFDHFMNHVGDLPKNAEPLWSRHLLALKDKEWRDMRLTLNPTFTSNKMRHMFELITEITEEFIQHFLNKSDEIIIIDMKDTYSRYANDVIASIAFGIKCDSLKERNNEFYSMSKEIVNQNDIWRNIKFFGYLLVSKLDQFSNFGLFSKRAGVFFVNLIKQTIKQRKEHATIRHDMIQSFDASTEEVNIAKSSLTQKQITEMDIAAYGVSDLDLITNVMCFMGYELGVNPDIQQRLRNEIDKTAEECNDKVTYEALMTLKYMDMVVSETLRKWPNASLTDRICTKQFTIEPTQPDEKPVHLNIGDGIVIPTFAIHHDPEYYPEPERFDPERFNDKSKVKPFTYIPFGLGPRSCIGSRFARIEIKSLYFYILRNFEIVPIEKTQIPMKIITKTFNITATDGFWFSLKRRNC